MNKQALDIAFSKIARYGQFMERLRTRTLQPVRRHRVYMSFVRGAAGEWHCRFHQDDLAKTQISKLFLFRDVARIRETMRRGNGLSDKESRQALDVAIANGHGGLWLRLSSKQYATLTSSGKGAPA